MGIFDRNPDSGSIGSPTSPAGGGGGSGETNTGSNLGGGNGVFSAKVAADLQFKSLVAGTNITITPSGTELLIAATGGASFPLLAPLGTAGAPSYSFTGDADTGIFSAGANQLNVTVGGTTRISVLASSQTITGTTIIDGSLAPGGVTASKNLGSSGNHWLLTYSKFFVNNIAGGYFGSDFNFGIPVTFQSGQSNTAANTGDTTVSSGDQISVGSGTVGNLILKSGSILEATNNNNSGNMLFSIGTVAGAGVQGDFKLIKTGDVTVQAGMVLTASAADGTFYWATPGGGAPTGTANTLAYFDGAGDLASDADVRFDVTNKRLSYVSILTSGTFSITGEANLSHGKVEDSGNITNSAIGGMVGGYATGAASNITVVGTGAFAHGYVIGGGRIRAQGLGSFAVGYGGANSSGVYAFADGSFACGWSNSASNSALATASGSFAHGYVTGSSASLEAGGLGSMSSGYCAAFGLMRSTSAGSHIFGRASGTTGQTTFSSSGNGSFAAGGFACNVASKTINLAGGTGSIFLGSITGSNTWSNSGAGSFLIGSFRTNTIISNNSEGGGFIGQVGDGGRFNSSAAQGGLAIGYHFGTAEILGGGSFVSGQTSNANCIISAGGSGSWASGTSTTSGSTISTTANSAFARGHATSGRDITASGIGSVAWGSTISNSIASSGAAAWTFGDDTTTSADLANSWGLGHVNNTYLTTVLGRWAVTPTANLSTWVATDPLFVIGIGASGATRANAFEVIKNGQVNFVGKGKIGIADGTTDFSNTWGADIPGLIFDVADADVAAAFGAGILYKGTNSESLAFLTSDQAASGTAPLYLGTGYVTAGTGSAGEIGLYGGNAQGTAGNGGRIFLAGGQSTNGPGGYVTLNAGTGVGGVQENIYMNAGSLRLPTPTGDPVTLQNGMIWYNITANQLKAYVSNSIVILA